jgi:hypothetical protein
VGLVRVGFVGSVGGSGGPRGDVRRLLCAGLGYAWVGSVAGEAVEAEGRSLGGMVIWIGGNGAILLQALSVQAWLRLAPQEWR